LPEKSKWTLALDEGGCRYEIMTTNISEVFNFILKGIHSLLVSGIVDYTFHKCNEYFVNRWEKAQWSLTKGKRWVEHGRKHLLEQGEISNNELCYLIPRSLCTRSSCQARLMLVVRYQEDTYFELRLAML
jgi:hypothetical protein